MFYRKWRHMKFSIFSKWMYRTSTIRNVFNSLRVFFHTWQKWRSYSPFNYVLFCNLTPLDGRFVNVIVFCRKSEFREYIISLHIQQSIYVHQVEFFRFIIWNKLHLYFVTFLLSVSIYSTDPSNPPRSIFFHIMMTLFAALSPKTKYKFMCILSILFFSDFIERLAYYLYIKMWMFSKTLPNANDAYKFISPVFKGKYKATSRKYRGIFEEHSPVNICERETSYCLIRSPYRP